MPTDHTLGQGQDSGQVGKLAGEDMPGHRVVRCEGEVVFLCSPIMLLQGNHRCFGLTTNAALQGESVMVKLMGTVTEPSWDWFPGGIFLGENGILTQEVPNTGVVQEVGVALDPTSLLVRVQQPMFMEE